MKWFPVDSDAPNDPKMKAILRRGVDGSRHQAAAGTTFLLWCYVANHGEADPGLAVRANGASLPLKEMATECYFEDTAGLTAFLNNMADVEHIHQQLWIQKQIVFLPAMWRRTAEYYRSKQRAISGFTSSEHLASTLLTGGQLQRVEYDKVSDKIRQQIYERDGFCCRYCGLDLLPEPKMRCLDHVFPFVSGGRAVEDNLVTACKKCNAKKGGRTPDQAGMTIRLLPLALGALPANKQDMTSHHLTEHETEGVSLVRPTSEPDLLKDVGPDQVDTLVVIWNNERKPGPLVRAITPERRRQALKALKEYPNLDDWRKVIRDINRQAWCNASGQGDHPNWRMDFDYLLKPGKFVKALERAELDRRNGTADGVVGRDARRGIPGTKPGAFAAALKGDDETGG